MLTPERYGRGDIVKGYDGDPRRSFGTSYSTGGIQERVRLRPNHDDSTEIARLDLEKRLDIPGFKDQVERMAFQYFGADGYRLTINGEERNLDADIERPVIIDLNVTFHAETDGRIEFYLQPNFNRKFGGTLHFIREVAEHVGCDIGYSPQELVKQAVKVLPNITGGDAVYKAVFQFTRDSAKISFELEGGRSGQSIVFHQTPEENPNDMPDFGNLKLYDSRDMAYEEPHSGVEGTGLIE